MITNIVTGRGNKRIVTPMPRDRAQRHLVAALIEQHVAARRPVAA